MQNTLWDRNFTHMLCWMLSAPQIPQCGDSGVVPPRHQWHPAGVHQAQCLPEVQRRRLLPDQWCAVQHGLSQLQHHLVSLTCPVCFLWTVFSICSVLLQSWKLFTFKQLLSLSGSGSVSTGSLSRCCMPHACPVSSLSLASPSTSSSTLFSWHCCSWTFTGSWWRHRFDTDSFFFCCSYWNLSTVWCLFPVSVPLFLVVHRGFRGEGAEDEGSEWCQGVRGRGRQQGGRWPAQWLSGRKKWWWCWTSHHCPEVSCIIFYFFIWQRELDSGWQDATAGKMQGLFSAAAAGVAKKWSLGALCRI